MFWILRSSTTICWTVGQMVATRKDDSYAYLWTTTVIRGLVPMSTARFARNRVAVQSFSSIIPPVEVLGHSDEQYESYGVQ